MTKKEIKAALAKYDYKMIKPSWHKRKGDECAIFNAYDEHGNCSCFFVDWGDKYARRTLMTDTDLRLEPVNIGFMFFEEA